MNMRVCGAQSHLVLFKEEMAWERYLTMCGIAAERTIKSESDINMAAKNFEEVKKVAQHDIPFLSNSV